MKEKVKLIVVIPIGPLGSSYTLDQLYDTIDSVIYYTTPDRRIILQDSSLPLRVANKVKAKFPEVLISPTPENYGLYGGLYKAESIAFLGAHTFFDYQLMVRMDIDALWIGHGLEDLAIEQFTKNPKLGMLGDFPASESGYDWPRSQAVRQGESPLGYLTDPPRYGLVNRLMMNARKNGWKPGEHLIGGAAILNPVLIGKLAEQGLLLREEIRRLKLQEDHIFGLLTRAVGMELGDFGSGTLPMSIAWRGLYASPQELIDQNKKLIHSTRGWKDMNEEQIRMFFRARRSSPKA